MHPERCRVRPGDGGADIAAYAALGPGDQLGHRGDAGAGTCHWNKSLSLHALGRYREGWKEHTWRSVERTQLPLYVPVNRFDAPMWHGEPPYAPGKPQDAHVGLPSGEHDPEVSHA